MLHHVKSLLWQSVVSVIRYSLVDFFQLVMTSLKQNVSFFFLLFCITVCAILYVQNAVTEHIGERALSATACTYHSPNVVFKKSLLMQIRKYFV